MYSRRNASQGSWITGFLIVIGVVVAFSLFQTIRQPQPTPATPFIVTTIPATLTPTILPTGTPRSATLRVISEKASLVAVITRVFFDKTDNWDVSYLNEYAGHLQGTAEIGEGGNAVLAGHVELKDGRPGPFANISRLIKGDQIAIVSDEPSNPVVKHYRVTEVLIVPPQDLSLIQNHGYEELTLVTCKDWNEQKRTYDKRVIVHARPVT